jgi:protease PrsW
MARLLLFVSIFPVFLLGSYIYNKDIDKEPKNLLTKLFFGGIISTVITLILSSLMGHMVPMFDADPKSLDTLSLIIFVFIGVALVEEFSKWIVLYVASYNHKEFDQLYDMIVYAVFVALGFACFENILYVFSGGLTTGIVRAFTALPGHACNGVFMGYYLGLAKINEVNCNYRLKRKNMFFSLFVPMLLHGIYDYLLFLNNWIFDLIFLVFLIIYFVITLGKVKRLSMLNSRFK